jgi:hypothetical protein
MFPGTSKVAIQNEIAICPLQGKPHSGLPKNILPVVSFTTRQDIHFTFFPLLKSENRSAGCYQCGRNNNLPVSYLVTSQFNYIAFLCRYLRSDTIIERYAIGAGSGV